MPLVTCNYEARRRGLHKLQLITEAKKICPDVIIVLGEELGRFRDASKLLYKYLESFTSSGKVERLGFDEVWMDVTDMVDWNQGLLNTHDLTNSFFHLNKNDPTIGFSYDATTIAGHSFPNTITRDDPTNTPLPSQFSDPKDDLSTRLILGSHIAQYLRLGLEENQGYTSTVGISTNKLLSKLVGNLNKPKGQTTLLPPYTDSPDSLPNPEVEATNNVQLFLDPHEIGKIPGIGCKISQKLRNHILSRPAAFSTGLIYGPTEDPISVHDVRTSPSLNPAFLESLLSGPGSHRGTGLKIWNLVHGIDDSEVQQVKKVPTQISIEDSYIRLNTLSEVRKELTALTTTLLKRMHIDLLTDNAWLAHPKTIRLSTRPRPPLGADGTRTRSFTRISRSAPLPSYVFTLKDDVDSIAEKLVTSTLIPMFKYLHPQPSGWDLSLMNVAVTNMVEVSTEKGRDIKSLFSRKREWDVVDRDVPPDDVEEMEDVVDSVQHNVSHSLQPDTETENPVELRQQGSEDLILPLSQNSEEGWDDDGEEEVEGREGCVVCGAMIPRFAMDAHGRWHVMEG
ncbi:DNA/RNA polymerase [Glarea lozoyensis ATCC 20868]|uniref:DNA/RNA polymerase n=1 Tax=Glarea lozoyensis (strain ATCC 20868 / MF5171) TaxID=1116229 RepID=S3DTV5_GLAL2|nr:DNA/RNA polymerase [Glarea lozoyensis ATCC 20868]EPE35371.1 DNA/RNA polymerase [Glarea lozoyensis ATCC 20868]